MSHKPINVSSVNWDKARQILSRNFTVSIGDRFEEVVEFATNLDNLESYGYKFATWEEFSVADDKPEGLIERSLVWEPNVTDFVVYDPEDDANGYFILSWNGPAIAKEACEYIIRSEPEDGPLSVDRIVMKEIENA